MCEPPDAELIGAAQAAGVARILTVGLDEATNREAIAAAEAHPDVFACVGRHPNSATGFDARAAEDIEALAAHERVVAIGETGLDYYRDHAARDEQRAAFEAQIEIARRTELPLVIHVRDPRDGDEALGEVFATLGSAADGVTVVLHCCSAPPQRIPEAAERGWYCSFAGNVTYPKATDLQVAAAAVPDELLLLETDAPYLAPVPHRGRPNEPAYVMDTLAFVAGLRGRSSDALGRQVEENAGRAFRLP